jgi:hypothetical protein
MWQIFMANSKRRVLFGFGGLAAGACLALALAERVPVIAALALKPRLFVLSFLALLFAYPLVLLLRQAWRSLEKSPRLGRVVFLAAAALVGFAILLVLRAFQMHPLSLGKAFIIAANVISLVLLLPLFLLVLSDWAWAGWRWLSQTGGAGERLALIYPRVFIAIFLVLLLLPLIGFTGDVAQLQQDFWGAAVLRQAYSGLRQYLFHDIYFDKVVIGRDGWLVLGAPGSLDDFQRTHLFSQEDLKAIQTRLDDTYTKLKAQGILFYVVLPPDKNTIYPEYLPTQIPVLGKTSRLDQLIAYQKQYGQAPILDLRPALLAEKQFRPVYFTTDTHWNPYGAFAATQAMLLPLQQHFPGFKLHSLSDYEKPPGIHTQGDLARNSVPSAVGEEWFGLKPKFGRQWVRYNLSDQMPVIVSTVNINPALPRAVIYHDSFMIWQYDFVADEFSKVTFIWSYNVDMNFARGEKADVVFLECTERYLDSLVSPGSTWNKD